MRSTWWLIALALGCRSSIEPEQSAVADISGRVLSEANVPIPASHVEVRCAGKVMAESVTDSNGVYSLTVTFPSMPAQPADDIGTCAFASPTFAEPSYWAEADISVYAPGLPHPLQFVDLHELP